MVSTRPARRAFGHNRVLKLLKTRVPLVRFEAVRCETLRSREKTRQRRCACGRINV